ncbi:hypothetical protein HDV06_003985 [Boothiomyces sp. JEL0866]|nr:hypothetical protein HDV06_003985 [Boothiomyces sp. JEL0866]
MSLEEKTKTGISLILYYKTQKPANIRDDYSANVQYYEIDIDKTTEKLLIKSTSCPCYQWYVDGHAFDTPIKISDKPKVQEAYERIILQLELPQKFENFIQSSGIRIVYFYAEWAKINQATTERAKMLARSNHVLILNVDDHEPQDIASAVGVSSFPCFKIYLNGDPLIETSDEELVEHICKEFKTTGTVPNLNRTANKKRHSFKREKTQIKGGRIKEVKSYEDYNELLGSSMAIVYVHVKSNVEVDIKILDNLGFLHQDVTFLMVDADNPNNKKIVDLLQPDQYPFLRLYDKVNDEYIEVTLTSMRIILDEYKILQETRNTLENDLQSQELKHIEDRFKSIPDLIKSGKSIPNLKYGIKASLMNLAGSSINLSKGSSKQSAMNLSSASSKASVSKGDRKLARVYSDMSTKQGKKVSNHSDIEPKLVKVASNYSRRSSGASIIEVADSPEGSTDLLHQIKTIGEVKE